MVYTLYTSIHNGTCSRIESPILMLETCKYKSVSVVGSGGNRPKLWLLKNLVRSSPYTQSPPASRRWRRASSTSFDLCSRSSQSCCYLSGIQRHSPSKLNKRLSRIVYSWPALRLLLRRRSYPFCRPYDPPCRP